MRTGKFMAESAATRGRLNTIWDELTQLVDQGLADKETGHAVEAAAGAVNAAVHLLEMAERGCDDKEFCP